MDISTIITAILTAITTIVPVIIKQHNDNESIKGAISDKDKKQDTELSNIKTSLKEIKDYVDKLMYKTSLITKIRKSCNSIISVNSLDNAELLALLNNTRDKYVEVIENILNTDIKDLVIDEIKSDMLTFAKYVRNITDFDNIDTIDTECLYNKLKNDVVLPTVQIFLMRLEDDIIKDSNKYNGTFEKIAIGCLNNLITSIIKSYRDSKK